MGRGQPIPTEAADEFSKQAVPDLAETLPTPNPNVSAMEQLGSELDGAFLMGHSQTGNLPLEVALLDRDAAPGRSTGGGRVQAQNAGLKEPERKRHR